MWARPLRSEHQVPSDLLKVTGMAGAGFSVDYGAGRLNLETLLR